MDLKIVKNENNIIDNLEIGDWFFFGYGYEEPLLFIKSDECSVNNTMSQCLNVRTGVLTSLDNTLHVFPVESVQINVKDQPNE